MATKKTESAKKSAKKTGAKKSAKKTESAKKTKRTGKPRTGKNDQRWRPMHRGRTLKDGVFTAWLADPTGVDAEALSKQATYKDLSLSTLRKWLNGFGSGCGNGRKYPRVACDKKTVARIEAALKKTGATIDATEKKRLLAKAGA
jgi:hypothetical protein